MVEMKRLWFQHGGLGETLLKADFVFSEVFDEILIMAATTPGSKYPVTVFHPQLIQDSFNNGGLDVLPIGRYQVLPDELMSRVSRQFPEWVAHRHVQQPNQLPH
ncbi:hypothetical protein HDE_11367 [Halotydeus destructor]|nr:hypothetical protein HDE_11367 [Halotydeus destructor]